MNLLYCAAFILFSLVKGDKWCCGVPDNIDGRIAQILSYANHNNDSQIDVGDELYDLQHNFDKNHDNKTSKLEWVLTRECIFGDNYAISEPLFNNIDIDKDNFLTKGEILQNPAGVAKVFW